MNIYIYIYYVSLSLYIYILCIYKYMYAYLYILREQVLMWSLGEADLLVATYKVLCAVLTKPLAATN